MQIHLSWMELGLKRILPRKWSTAWGMLVMSFVLATSLSAWTQNQPPSGPAEVKTADASPAPVYHLPPAKLAKAIALNRARLFVHFGSELWELVALWLFLVTGLAARLGAWTRTRTSRGWLQGGIFSAIAVTLIFVVVQAPSDAISHAFSLDYGISIEKWLPWLADEAKTLGLTVALEAPLLMLVFGLLHWSPKRYWLWMTAAAVPIMLLGTFLLPPLIEPLFNKFEPLSQAHPALVADLEKVVARTGTSIPPERMFLMKASEKTNGLNAYVTGIGASKRIVVWDTTAGRIPEDEVLFIFGHETGHYVLNHIPKGLVLMAVGMFALFWATARIAEWLVNRFGRGWQVESLASLPGLVVLVLALTALQIVTEPVQSTVSRHFEHESDVFGQEAVHGIVADPQKTAVAAFNDLGEAYLEDPNPSPLIEFWSYDHPSLKNRAAFAAQYDPWAPGKAPRFFPK